MSHSSSVRREGDIIEVKLMDSDFNRYFHKKARINKPVEMRELIQELEMKGLSLSNFK